LKNLSAAEHKTALKLNRTLQRIREKVESADDDKPVSVSGILADVAEDLVSDPAIELDYLAAVDEETLEDVTVVHKGIIFAIAAYIGETRLIDNWIYR